MSNDTLHISAFGMNIAYGASPIISYDVYNYCWLNMTAINTTEPVFARSLTGAKTTIDITSTIKFEKTNNNGCQYYSQNIYADPTLKTLIFSKRNTQLYSLDPTNLQVDLGNSGTQRGFYYVKLDVAYYAQKNQSCMFVGDPNCNPLGYFPVQYTVCGQEKITPVSGPLIL